MITKIKCVGGFLDGIEIEVDSQIIETEENGMRSICYSLHNGFYEFDPGGEKFFARIRKEHALD